MDSLKWNTVSPQLANALQVVMNMEELREFRLVGGTNLSLRYGHRLSQDIDLFTDALYGSIDYSKIERKLKEVFPYFESPYSEGPVGFGRMYYAGLK